MLADAFNIFFGAFIFTLQLLTVIVGALTAIACCVASGWLISWSIGRLWALARVQSDDASRKREG